MTFKGTNTYIIDNGELAVIDPGPAIDEHFNNILDLVGDRQVKYIFLTHSHVDHSSLAKKLSRKLNTPIYAFGGSNSGLSSTMLSLIENGYVIFNDTDAGGDTEVGVMKIINGSNPINNNISEVSQDHKKLVKILDALVRQVNFTTNQILFHIYDDGSVEKKFIVE